MNGHRRLAAWRALPAALALACACATGATGDDAGTDTGTETAADAAAVPRAGRQWPADVQAEQQRLATLPAPAGGQAAGQLARTLLAAPEFGDSKPRTAWTWEWRFHQQEKKKSDDDNGWLKRFAAFVESLAQALGTLGHVLLWLLLLALLLVLWRRRDALLALLPRARAAGTRIAGIDIAPLLAPDALPDDVVAGAEHLWRAGHPRDALSLLYRAALHRIGHQREFAIPESGTESECLDLVARHADRDTADAFRELVNAWMRLAWQHRPPADIAPLVAAYRRAAAGAPDAFAVGTAGGAA